MGSLPLWPPGKPYRAHRINNDGDFSGGPVVKSPLPNAGDVVLILGQGTKDPTYQGATEPMCHN